MMEPWDGPRPSLLPTARRGASGPAKGSVRRGIYETKVTLLSFLSSEWASSISRRKTSEKKERAPSCKMLLCGHPRGAIIADEELKEKLQELPYEKYLKENLKRLEDFAPTRHCQKYPGGPRENPISLDTPMSF
jgi:hypothetical protein